MEPIILMIAVATFGPGLMLLTVILISPTNRR